MKQIKLLILLLLIGFTVSPLACDTKVRIKKISALVKVSENHITLVEKPGSRGAVTYSVTGDEVILSELIKYDGKRITVKGEITGERTPWSKSVRVTKIN